MKNQQALLLFIFFLFVTTSVFAQKPSLSASVIMGISPPKKGLEYNAGFGVKGGAHIGHLYAGVALFAHTGDELSIRYGSASGVGINSGRQNYKWKPKFLMADIGYEIKIKLGPSLSSSFMPYFSTGLASIKVSSSGVYGSPDDLKINKLGLGGGFSYSVAIIKRLSVGLDYRLYPLGDIHADFGDASENRIEHGFHTAGYYDALFAVASYRF
jgi:opacity protein-like surface antigen